MDSSSSSISRDSCVSAHGLHQKMEQLECIRVSTSSAWVGCEGEYEPVAKARSPDTVALASIVAQRNLEDPTKASEACDEAMDHAVAPTALTTFRMRVTLVSQVVHASLFC